MAHKYVYSAAAGAATGADWANAYLTLAAAFTGSAAGDDIWVAHDHAETQASAMTLTSPGTVSNPCKVHCVNRSGSVPPVAADLATTATIATTGNNALTFASGYAYIRGIIFRDGSGAVSAAMSLLTSTGGLVLDQCGLEIVSTGASVLNIGASSATNYDVKLINTRVKFGGVTQNIVVSTSTFRWEGGSVDASGSAPTTLFVGTGNRGAILVQDVDLSHLGSGKTLVGALGATAQFRFVNCKLGASVAKVTAPTVPGPRISFVRCDSGSTNYTEDEFDHYGTLSTETTIVRTGGASDGTTPIAHKIVTGADAKWINPFRSKPIIFWNEGTSAITVTLEGIWGGGAVPNNDDIWFEAEYLDDASTPLGAIATTGKASHLAAGAPIAAGSGTWGGSTTKFAMSATFTPDKKGPIALYVKAGAASSTFYIDPKPVVT